MPKVTPFLWFDTQAEEAVDLYVSVFRDAKKGAVSHYSEGTPMPVGSVMTVSFTIGETDFIALNGGPDHKFTDAVSFVVHANTQEEIDEYWDKLTSDGGKPVACGWLTDKYGLSWQIVPDVLGELMTDPDPARAGRASQAMMKMTKIDIKALQDAANGK